MFRTSRLLGLASLLLLTAGCAPPAAAPAATAVPATNRPAAAAPAAVATTAPAQPSLVTAPSVDLKVGVILQASYAPFFIAQERGYFTEMGLNVEFFPTGNILDQLPAIAQGQLHVGTCSSGVACFNALNRRTDVKIVADLQSAGKTEKSTGNLALVVRK